MDLSEEYLNKSMSQQIKVVDRNFCNLVSIPNTALCHFRLGHASMPLISKLSSQVPYVNSHMNGICDICSFAKQRRSNFHVRKSRTSKPFDLLHMDIWGPYPGPSVCT